MTEEFTEIRHMVKTFRVSELQELLGYANRSKTGRKHQLMGRALDMLKDDPGSKVCGKIRELYGSRYPRRFPYVPPPSNYSSGPNVGESSVGRMSLMTQPNRPVRPPSSSLLPVHPDVKLRHLPFYDFKDILVRPQSLVPQCKTTTYQDSFIMFHISPHQVNEIVSSRDTRPMSNNEYNVQIQLRFCLLETSCEQDDMYPRAPAVKINGKPCPLPRFVATVHLVRKVTSSCLINRLKARQRRNPDHSKALIKEKLTQDPDSEVATTSLRCSLLCPLGKTRMTIPCRSKNCNHLQCFDAALYLQMNERKSRWICPVCDQEARFDNLIIDGLFMEILEKSPQSNDIVFFEDGSWEALGTSDQAAKMTVISTPKAEKPEVIEEEKPKRKHDPHVIDLTVSSDEEDEYNTAKKPSTSSRIPVLSSASSSHHLGVPGQPSTSFYPNLISMGSQPDLGAYTDLPFYTLSADSFPFYGVGGNLDQQGGMCGQTAAHAINLD
ncbi:E3 SUMO-protein ligase PIAS2-like isoform X2 [Xenia sp. Carnegie-2017]|uniref:E3 SUMO-protein ligase PIAS2-like isoform X2 n=1 Tax=Xenia sp. Carnegie-2017 TaxID=2897299 RepID=UPI001F043C44|nr:E3 SUMO-protein ligase PIAS2-like isoform X2 [Xenia sp. Carnegie-2017]